MNEIDLKNKNKPIRSCNSINQSDYRRLQMHEIERTARGSVAGKVCELHNKMDAPGCAGEASMCIPGKNKNMKKEKVEKGEIYPPELLPT